MHRFLRAIGFSDVKNRQQLNNIIVGAVQHSFSKVYTPYEGEMFAEYKAEVASSNGASIGLCVRGAYEGEKHHLLCDYYFPYVTGRCFTTGEEISIEKHAEKTSYAGALDDLLSGLTLIFYMQDIVPFMQLEAAKKLPQKGAKVSFSALSDDGMIIFPIAKTEEEKTYARKQQIKKAKMLLKAKDGDEEAMENLSASDIDLSAEIQERIKEGDDVFSLVDTTMIPYGVECDLYTILGEIVTVDELTNIVTGEKVYVMALLVNDVPMDVCINEKDLFGEPAVGRRFKGTIWLQGRIDFGVSS